MGTKDSNRGCGGRGGVSERVYLFHCPYMSWGPCLSLFVDE